MFGKRVLAVAGVQGLSTLAAVLGVYLWAVLTDRPDAGVRAITFTALVVGNLALISTRLRLTHTYAPVAFSGDR